MDESTLQILAAQLRKPEGEAGKKTGEMMNFGNRHINRAAIEKLDPRPGEKILEIGMGNGFFVKEIFFRENSVEYFGCDYSKLMVEEAKAMNENFVANGQAKFFLSSADKLPLEENFFDKIFTVNTIYFWENPREVLAEFRRVLKPGGKIFLAFRPKRTMQNYPFVQYGFTLYSADDTKKLLEENSFRVEDTIEAREPDQEIAGEKVAVEHAIAVGVRK